MATKKLEELSVLEINAEIGLRMEAIEIAQFQIRELRDRRAFLANNIKNEEIISNPPSEPAPKTEDHAI